ncbi:MAG: hypothetical protein DSM106950_37605, partial [Stigonema ocellatum SAG 48.90 = DSM 106950]|nr:hypothetical protein [Stigonema ocellatum SAG 48.90 = DSM 106950]
MDTYPKHYGLLSRNGFISWEKLGVAVAPPNLREQMQYRRAKTLGGTYFFTVVTYQREKSQTMKRNFMNLPEEEFTLQLHPRTQETVSLEIPKDTLDSLKKIAQNRDMT